jgi:hypothetical protein
MKTKTTNKYSHYYPVGTFTGDNPIDIDDATYAFPGSIAHLMPPVEIIPDEFFDRNDWADLASTWMFRGLADYSFNMKEGINGKKAFRHMEAIMRSFQPKHEYKIAAVGYLLSIWTTGFNKI